MHISQDELEKMRFDGDTDLGDGQPDSEGVAVMNRPLVKELPEYWLAITFLDKGKNSRFLQHGFIGTKTEASAWIKTRRGRLIFLQSVSTIKKGIEDMHLKEFAHVQQATSSNQK